MKSGLRGFGFAVGLGVGLLGPPSAHAQVPDSLRASQTAIETVPDTVTVLPDSTSGISPGGAFLRSALIPGWGHAKVGAHGRGAFYFAIETAAAFMVVKSQSRLSLAQNRVKLKEDVVTTRLQAQGFEDPLELEEQLAADEELAELRGLETARGEQREDWVAIGIFFLFLGGADAFVSAHLAEFPEPVEINLSGEPTGRVEVAISVPVGF